MSLKAELLQLIAGKNRGLRVTEKENVQILSTVEKLEDHNPTANPFKNPELLNGDWRLLYTTSKSILNLENLPMAHLGEIYQCIRVEANKIYNIAEISGLPFMEGLISVAAKFEKVSIKRVNVKFNRSIIGLQRLLGYLSPKDLIAKMEQGNAFPALDLNFGEPNFNLPMLPALPALPNNIFDRNSDKKEQSGWLEITYLDDSLRIGRGHQGNVFILERCSR